LLNTRLINDVWSTQLAKRGRLLSTHLTVEGRRYVERRAAEEQAALPRANDPISAAFVASSYCVSHGSWPIQFQLATVG
jgi:hypothetical protein